MSVSENVKALINGTRDEKISALTELTRDRLSIKLGLGPDMTIPDQLEYIVTRAVTAMFNRIGSEGTSSHWVMDEKMDFVDDELAVFDADIQDYLKVQEGSRAGRVRFI